MISKINWEALKVTNADSQNHQLGETIYKHIPAAKRYGEHIIAHLNKILWICWKTKNGWSLPFVTK